MQSLVGAVCGGRTRREVQGNEGPKGGYLQLLEDPTEVSWYWLSLKGTLP